MEDAMILNKAGLDRGLARGYLYKTETLDLKKSRAAQQFAAPKSKPGRAPASAGGAEERPHTIFGQRFPQNVAVQVGCALHAPQLTAVWQFQMALVSAPASAQCKV